MGTTNVLVSSAGDLQYQLPFTVQVTSTEGTPAPFVAVSFTARPTSYQKGYYQAIDTDVPTDGTPDEWQATYTATCNVEDSNYNGLIDSGEDINGNYVLDPTNPATVSSHPTLTPTIENIDGRLVTDEDGFGYFVLTYPPSEAYWVSIRLIATAPNNSQREIYDLTLPALDADLSNIDISPPGGINGKYGAASVCTDPN